ncbi:hypothetical protein BpHYR1_004229 [Brachionus plicatilis]|uniref:WSC domain-containing protein n=1 Tax=Brachionus plicatilis TaxID=10195 RepID=A0A3M7QCF8_BRAPC|nr:hypothetical protein BpHYR1_004229 [Brachionus plicatilis]
MLSIIRFYFGSHGVSNFNSLNEVENQWWYKGCISCNILQNILKSVHIKVLILQNQYTGGTKDPQYNISKFFFSKNKQSAEFLGCYAIGDKYFSYAQGFLYNADMSISSCLEFCHKFAFMWLKKGVECTCSDSLDELRHIDDKACNLKCNDYQSCGASQEGVFMYLVLLF